MQKITDQRKRILPVLTYSVMPGNSKTTLNQISDVYLQSLFFILGPRWTKSAAGARVSTD